MLELRPLCENCECVLPADSKTAMICSYECTFCQSCVEDILENVCPNCGGGFQQRPIRPNNDWREGTSLAHQPAGTRLVVKPIEVEAHNLFSKSIKPIPPEDR